ncbi:hypothetical protein [Shinella sp. BYT-45]|uniref:hypothetical protein n=1 Tax=Shinella sp. BYT-45 TaxID=3377377 RepID=UPI00398105D0
MSTVLLTYPVDKAFLLDLQVEDIRAIVAENVDAARKHERDFARRIRNRDAALEQAIQNVARASARVDAANNTRDEIPSIHALIAAASGLRRAVEASKKGL